MGVTAQNQSLCLNIYQGIQAGILIKGLLHFLKLLFDFLFLEITVTHGARGGRAGQCHGMGWDGSTLTEIFRSNSKIYVLHLLIKWPSI